MGLKTRFFYNMKEESSQRSFYSFELYPTDTVSASESGTTGRKHIFRLLVLLNIVLNYDSGVIPASLLQINEDVPMTYTETAGLVSISYLGLGFSSLFVSSIFQKYSATKVILFTQCLNSGFCLLFSFSSSVPMMLASRLGMGFTQAFLVVYAPVWINEFSPKQKESLWMGILQGSVPIGVVLGYSLAAFFRVIDLFTWRFSIQVQSILQLPLIVWFGYLEADDVDILDHSQDSFQLAGLKDQVKMLLLNKLYLLLAFALGSLYFVVSGVQYWVTLYMLRVLQQNFAVVILCFVVTSVTAPLTGVFCGGRVIEFVGGYKGKNLVDALWVCFISALLAAFCTFPACIANGAFGAFVSIWLMLFFGAAVVPCATGACVNSVEREYQANTSSFLQICANVGGFFLSPLVSAFYMERFDDQTEGLKCGFRLVLSVSWIGCFFMGMALWTARKRLNI
jgi:MFS family permease